MRVLKSIVQIGLLAGGSIGLYKSFPGHGLLLSLSVCCFGLLIVITGRELWVYRRFSIHTYGPLDPHPKVYTGLMPRLWGGFLLWVGFLLVDLGATTALVPGATQALQAIFLETRPGLWSALSLLGILVSANGSLVMFDTVAWRRAGVTTRTTGDSGAVLGGVIIFLLGMGVLGYALWGILLSELFDHLLGWVLLIVNR